MSRNKKIVSCEVPSFIQDGSTIFIATLSDDLCVNGLASFLPRYGMAFSIYFDFKSKSYPKLDTEFVWFVVIILC